MTFMVELDKLTSQLFQWVPANPSELKVGRQRFQVFFCLNPAAHDSVMVELRPVIKKENK